MINTTSIEENGKEMYKSFSMIMAFQEAVLARLVSKFLFCIVVVCVLEDLILPLHLLLCCVGWKNLKRNQLKCLENVFFCRYGTSVLL